MSPRYIRPSPRYLFNTHQRPMDAGELAVALGAPRFGPGAYRTPPEGVPTTIIGGVLVWAVPRQPGKFRIRVMALCPRCSKVLAASRLNQHVQTSRSCA